MSAFFSKTKKMLLLWVLIATIFCAFLLYLLSHGFTPAVRLASTAGGSVASIPFRTDRNDMPVVDLHVGTPPQRVQVVLDTGSSDLVITGRSCKSCNGSSFDPEKSKTIERGNQCTVMTYGTQQDSGCWHTDTVRFGNDIERRMTFVVTTERSKSPYNGTHPLSQYSILGLAMTESASAVTQLLPHNTFTIVNDHGNHSLILSEYDDYAPENTHTFVKLPMTPYQDLYAASIAQCMWDAAPIPVHTIVMDSGSNMVFLPSNLWTDEMTKARDARKDLVFQFPGAMELKFVVPGKSVKKFVMPYESDDAVVIVGCLILQESILEFNVATKSVRVAQL